MLKFFAAILQREAIKLQVSFVKLVMFFKEFFRAVAQNKDVTKTKNLLFHFKNIYPKIHHSSRAVST